MYEGIPTYARMLARGDARSPADVAVVGNEVRVRERLRSYSRSGVTDLCAMVFAVGGDAASRAKSQRRCEDLLATLAA
jgi:alkanesulfonate monooxygenase SsuD/methylene tetrahydromethanopterin reductase-like flavin-dependent oxidoreductase (luciferase family)